MSSNIEIDTYFYYGQPTEGKPRRIVLQVYLTHGYLCTLVKFELKEVYVGSGTQYHVYPPGSGAFLYVDIVVQDREDDVHHLLVMPFGVGVIAVRDGGEICLEHLQGTVQVAATDKGRHLGNGGGALSRVLSYVMGQQAAVQACSNLSEGLYAYGI